MRHNKFEIEYLLFIFIQSVFQWTRHCQFNRPYRLLLLCCTQKTITSCWFPKITMQSSIDSQVDSKSYIGLVRLQNMSWFHLEGLRTVFRRYAKKHKIVFDTSDCWGFKSDYERFKQEICGNEESCLLEYI